MTKTPIKISTLEEYINFDGVAESWDDFTQFGTSFQRF